MINHGTRANMSLLAACALYFICCCILLGFSFHFFKILIFIIHFFFGVYFFKDFHNKTSSISFPRRTHDDDCDDTWKLADRLPKNKHAHTHTGTQHDVDRKLRHEHDIDYGLYEPFVCHKTCG